MKKFFLAGLVAAGIAFSGTAMAADGAAIFKSKCTACHGADGQGTAMGPAFKGNQFIKTSAPEAIADVVKNGREGAAKKYKNIAIGMPKQTLKDDEIKAVIDHLKSIAAK